MLLLMTLLACGEEVHLYECSCTKIAYNAGEDSGHLDMSFHEKVCDTEENVKEQFSENGDLQIALANCRTEMAQISDDYECDCSCNYVGDC